jgi:hypothetical protein
MMWKHGLSVSILVASARLAAAQGAPPPPPPPPPGDPALAGAAVDPHDPATAPGFVTLGRQDGNSRAGVEISYLFPKIPSGSNLSATALRIEPHGQYVDPASGFGGYASLPITYLSESANGASESATGIGDVDLGVLYLPKLSEPNVAIVLFAGATLPTGSKADPNAMGLQGVSANLVGLQTRLTDYYLVVPAGLTLRGGGALLYRQDQMFLRAEGRVDISQSADGNTLPTAYQFNFGAGFQTGDIALMAESTNFVFSGDRSLTVNMGAVSVRYSAGNVHPYAALILPLDDDAKSGFDAVITVGAEMNLR